MSFIDKILHRGQNHLFIPFDEMDLSKVEGEGKVGYKAKNLFDPYYRKAKFQARHRNPIVQNMNDYVQWVFYDRITFAAGLTSRLTLSCSPFLTGVVVRLRLTLTWINLRGLMIRD